MGGLQKTVGREGPGSDDKNNSRQGVPGVPLSMCQVLPIHYLIESTLYEGGPIYPHFTEGEIEA